MQEQASGQICPPVYLHEQALRVTQPKSSKNLRVSRTQCSKPWSLPTMWRSMILVPHQAFIDAAATFPTQQFLPTRYGSLVSSNFIHIHLLFTLSVTSCYRVGASLLPAYLLFNARRFPPTASSYHSAALCGTW